ETVERGGLEEKRLHHHETSDWEKPPLACMSKRSPRQWMELPNNEPRKTTKEMVSRRGKSQRGPAFTPTRLSRRSFSAARAANAAVTTPSEMGPKPSITAAMNASGSAWIAPEPI